MAFHPFATFRKNQKFWMASLILLCMVTFVLCTGVSGDFGSRLIDLVTHGFRGSPTVARLFERNVGLRELEQLREQRNIANDYMREASRRVLLRVDLEQKDISKAKEAEQNTRLNLLKAVELDLIERLKKPRYFDTGNKVEELLDFLIWRKEVERLGLQLTREATRSEIERALHVVLRLGEDRGNEIYLFDTRDSRDVEQTVSNQHYRANSETINKALREEFEVQIAKLVLSAVRPSTLYYGSWKSPSFYSPLDYRQAPSPEQYWSYFRQNRAETDFALLPLPVEAFIPKVMADPKLKPTERDLIDLFEKYKGKEDDPTAVAPGFKSAERVKVEWVAADPYSRRYLAAAQTLLTMQATPPFFTPDLPGLQAAIRLGAGNPALEAALHRKYKELAKGGKLRAQPLTDAGFPLNYYTRFDSPEGVASMVAAAAVPANPLLDGGLGSTIGAVYANQSAAYLLQHKSMTKEVAEESRKRAQWFTTLSLTAALPVGLMGAGGASPAAAWPAVQQWNKAFLERHPLPFASVRDDLYDAVLRRTAVDLAHANMDFARKKLTQDGTAGNPKYIKIRLDELAPRFGLIHKTTQQPRSRYDIADDPALKEFKDKFEDGKFIAQINLAQGRGGTETMLKPDEFWKLFFHPNEEVSIRNDGPYFPRPWPPLEVEAKNQLNPAAEKTKVALWDKAAMPILYWKTENQPAKTPPNLAAVRKEVERAWYYLKAREYLLERDAKEIAEAVQKSVDKLKEDTLDAESVKVGLEILKLRGVAPLVPDHFDPSLPVRYGPYPLRKEAVPHPRPEMVQELLALRDLKSPIEIPINKDDPNQKLIETVKLIESVNKLNKDLLGRKVSGYQAQILTNRPLSIFYVTVVTRAHEPSFEEFHRTYERAVSQTNRDWLLTQSQEKMGQQFERELIAQLRAAAGFEITDADEQKRFDEAAER